MAVQLPSTFMQEDNSMCLRNAGTHLPDCTIYQTAHGPYITIIIKIVHNLTIDFTVLVPQEQTKTVNVMHKYHGDIALLSSAMVFIICSTYSKGSEGSSQSLLWYEHTYVGDSNSGKLNALFILWI
jgi:hypothetical protein